MAGAEEKEDDGMRGKVTATAIRKSNYCFPPCVFPVFVVISVLSVPIFFLLPKSYSWLRVYV